MKIVKASSFALIGGIAGLIIGLVYTSHQPAIYTSQATIFPPPYQDTALILKNSRLGIELHTDRLLEVLNSRNIRKRLIQKLDLIHYFPIDTTLPSWQLSLDEQVASHMQIDRTYKLSVVIKAFTRDPQLSADLVNGLIDLAGPAWQEIFRTNNELGEIYIVDRAEVDKRRKGPSYLKNLLITTIGMALLMGAIWLWWERLKIPGPFS